MFVVLDICNSFSMQMSIVKAGILPHLVDMMTGDKFPEEHAVATDCLWSLCFHPDNKENIKMVCLYFCWFSISSSIFISTVFLCPLVRY